MSIFLDDGSTPLRCPDCPICGHPPFFVLHGCVQAFCGNEDCAVMCWNPSRTQAENLADVTEHEVPDPIAERQRAHGEAWTEAFRLAETEIPDV